MSKKLTDEELSYIYNNYTNKNKTTTQIAKEMNRSQTTVERNLVKMGVDVKTQSKKLLRKIKEEQYDYIIDMYVNHELSTKKIAEIIGVSDRTVAKMLVDNGVTLRPSGYISKVKNHSYFHDIDTEEKAYWLGWMMSDGSIVRHHSRKDRSLNISMCQKSECGYIIENFAKAISADKSIVRSYHRIYNGKDRYITQISFASQEMAEDLMSHGVCCDKTEKQIMPKIEEKLIKYFIRGYFEGNGSVYISQGKIHVAFYGSNQIITDIRDFMYNNGIFNNVSITHRNRICSIHYGSQLQIKTLFDYLYGDFVEDNMVMYRKYNIFKNFYNI